MSGAPTLALETGAADRGARCAPVSGTASPVFRTANSRPFPPLPFPPPPSAANDAVPRALGTAWRLARRRQPDQARQAGGSQAGRRLPPARRQGPRQHPQRQP